MGGTLDQHHTVLRIALWGGGGGGGYTGSTSHCVEDCSMEGHTESTSHWVIKVVVDCSPMWTHSGLMVDVHSSFWSLLHTTGPFSVGSYFTQVI